MRRNQKTRAIRTSHRLTAMLRGGVLVSAVALSTLVAGAAGAAPTDQKAAKISRLVNQIATTDQNLTDLDNTLAVKREAVNRALVDFQNSIVAERLAAVAAQGARKSLVDADRRLASAQKSFEPAGLRTFSP